MSTLFDLPFEEPSADESTPAPAEPRRVLSVSELSRRIRACVEDRFPDVWVEGELSNCRVWNTGHMYFTLKDSGAQIKGVIFRSTLRALRFSPQDGLRVVVRGRIGVYEPKGEYQLVSDALEPEGLGALQLAFDQLKERLSREGLFDPRRKRSLPLLPRRIGIVTSLDGAAVRDILTVLHRRHANLHVVIRPARVQGDGAALEIARGIAAICKVPGVDVVIVGRGGGSIEDLWAFNEEVVARALAGCSVPTISAVGHETDVTIADFVADMRAPTPSAAAEMVVAPKEEFIARIERLERRAATAIRTGVHRGAARLGSIERRSAYAGFRTRVALRGRQTDDLSHELHRAIRSAIASRERTVHTLRLKLDTFDLHRRLGTIRARLVRADGRASALIERCVQSGVTRLGETVARLHSLSPLAVLGRGYAVCWNADRTVILRDVDNVARGDQVHVRLQHGELSCTVDDAE